MDPEIAGLLGYIAVSLAFGGVVVGGVIAYRRIREHQQRVRDAWLSTPPVIRAHNYHPWTGPYSPPAPRSPEPLPAPAPRAGVDPLLAGIIGYEVGRMMSSEDAPSCSTPDPTPAFEAGGGSFGGGGASDSWGDSGGSGDSGGGDSGGGSSD